MNEKLQLYLTTFAVLVVVAVLLWLLASRGIAVGTPQ